MADHTDMQRKVLQSKDLRMARNLVPIVPHILSVPTFPRLLRSNRVRATTPIFLSDPEIPPPEKPVVYSPVST